MESVVSVRHTFEDGFHTFTSPQMPGLLLTGPDDDFDGLWETIPAAIAALAEANLQKKYPVRPVGTFSIYRRPDNDARRQTLMHFVIGDA